MTKDKMYKMSISNIMRTFVFIFVAIFEIDVPRKQSLCPITVQQGKPRIVRVMLGSSSAFSIARHSSEL